MYQRRLRRRSVLVDVHSRIQDLSNVENVLREGAEDMKYDECTVDKATLIDYLNLTKLLVQKDLKISRLEMTIRKVATGAPHSERVRLEQSALVKLDRDTTHLQDEYARTAGVYSAFLSGEELWRRVSSLPVLVRHRAGQLIVCLQAFASEQTGFHQTDDGSEGLRGHGTSGNLYMDALNDFDPNIAYLPHVDEDKLGKALTACKVDADDMKAVAAAVVTLFSVMDGKVRKAASLSTIFQGEKTKQVQQIVSCLHTLKRPCNELHCDRFAIKPGMLTLSLAGQTGCLHPSVLKDDALDSVPYAKPGRMTNAKGRSKGGPMYAQDEETDALEMLLDVIRAVLNGLAVVSAFRSVLFSEELQAMRGDWSFSDVTGFEDLEQLI